MTGHQGTHAAARRHRQSEFLRNAVRVMWSLIAAVVLLLAGFTFYPEWTRLSDMKKDLASRKRSSRNSRKPPRVVNSRFSFCRTTRIISR